MATGPRAATGPQVPLSTLERTLKRAATRPADPTPSAIQKALDLAATTTKAVALSSGDVLLKEPLRLPAGVTLFGEGEQTTIKAAEKGSVLIAVTGANARVTRLMLEGFDRRWSAVNDSRGVVVSKQSGARIDHCQIAGFSWGVLMEEEASGTVEACGITDNLRDGLGYGVGAMSGAYVKVVDNEFAHNRHSFTANGAIDDAKGTADGMWHQRPGIRPTRFEFCHNLVRNDWRVRWTLAAVDAHAGMSGTFRIENNRFEQIRWAIAVAAGSGVINGNEQVFLFPWASAIIGIVLDEEQLNGFPVEGARPKMVEIAGNTFVGVVEPYRIKGADNVILDGALVETTRVPALVALPGEGE